MTKKIRCWMMSFLAIILCCFSYNTHSQFEVTYYTNQDKDHYSIVESVTNPANTVVAETIQGATLDIHVMEVDAAGNVVNETTYDSGVDEQAFHIAPSLNGGYVICGYQFNANRDRGLVIELNGALGLVNQARYHNTASKHSTAFHIIPTVADPIPGYVVVGTLASGFAYTDVKTSYALKLDGGLNKLWERHLNSAAPAAPQDWDMAVHVVEVPGQGYFVGGSATATPGTSSAFCDQTVMAAKITYANVVTWKKSMDDNGSGTSGHLSIGADAFYNAATNEIYQVANFSINHHFGIVVWDFATGNINLAKSFKVFSNLGYINLDGMRIFEAQDPNNYIVAGYVRDATHQNTDGSVVSGSFPFATEITKAAPNILWDELYPVPSSGYTASPSPYDLFHAGQQPLCLHPKMALRQSGGGGYTLVAPHEGNVATQFETELLQLNLVGLNPCLNTPIDLNPIALLPTEYPLGFTSAVLTKQIPALTPIGVSTTPDPCNTVLPCDVDANFTITDIGDCCYTFQDLTFDGGVAGATDCDEWTIQDAFGNVVTTLFGDLITFCFTTSGTYTICNTDCCFNSDGTITTETSCQTITVQCGEPCDPPTGFTVTPVAPCCVAVNFQNPQPCLISATGQATVDVNGDGAIDLIDTQILLANDCCIIDWGDGTTSDPTQGTIHCYTQSGTYTICMTTCCVGTDGILLYTETFCQDVTVECCDIQPNFVSTNDGCIWTFTLTNSGSTPLDQICFTWLDGTVHNGTDVIVVDLTGYCGIYGGCVPVYCCNNPSAVTNFCFDQYVCCAPCDPASDFTLFNDDCCVTIVPNSDVLCLLNAAGTAMVDVNGDGVIDLIDTQILLANNCCVVDWGDGTTTTDILTHCYATSGTYTICYTACCVGTDGQVYTETTCQTVDVNCCCLPFDFAMTVDGCNVCASPIWECANPTNYITYDWGDGFTGTSPCHNYGASGGYTICMTACCVNADGTSATQCVTICRFVMVDCGCDPVDFEWNILYNENCEIGACITPGPDPSQYCALWNWGDGTSGWYPIDICPVHTYGCPGGVFDICVTVYCCDVATLTPTSANGITVCHTVTVDCCQLPSSAFITADVIDCTAYFSIGSTDDYCGDICVSWDYGDGTTSNDGWSSTHTYSTTGYYTVCATLYCCNNPDVVMTVCIEIYVNCDCCYPIDFYYYTYDCTVCVYPLFDADCTNPSLVFFDYGDGTGLTSDLCHTYTSSGTYLVCMYAECPGIPPIGILCYDVTVNCGCCPNADFSWGYTANCYEVNFFGPNCDFINGTVFWSFGDGGTATGYNPSHIYSGPGWYTVCMHICCVNDDGTLSNIEVCHDVYVPECGCVPDADFWWETSYTSDGQCCLIFHDLTPDGNPYGCESWVFGLIQSQLAGDDVTFCFPSSGWYTVCHYDCCVDAAGNTYYDEVCYDVYVDCGQGCVTDADFTWEYSGNCCVTFHDLTPDGNPYGCESWVFGLIQSQLAGDDVTFCFPSSGWYTVCHYDCCVDAAGNTYYDEVCYDVYVDCGGGGCCMPGDFTWTCTDNCCFTFSPLTFVDCIPTANSFYWNFGDGGTSTDEYPIHCFTQDGVYQVCLTVTCPDGNTATYCHYVSVDCAPCINPAQIDPTALCTQQYDPVCGCDGITYPNDCAAYYYGGVTSWTQGPCPTPCFDPTLVDPNPTCVQIYDPVCGCDGITYTNSCYAQAAGNTTWTMGPCPTPCFDPALVDPNATCAAVYAPVCGCDGITYTNSCWAQAAGNTTWIDGPCNSPCIDPSLIDPTVFCAGYDPVCGCDGVTYDNACAAQLNFGVTSWTPGPCPTGGCCLPQFIDVDPIGDCCFTASVIYLVDCIHDDNTYEWILDGMSVAGGETYSWCFSMGGVHTICVNVLCPDGNIGVSFCETVDCGGGTGCCPPQDFVYNCEPNCCYTFSPLYLIDCVSNNTYFWDFGDGNSSTLENPTHCYYTNGVYQVCMTAICPDGTAVTYCQWITVQCAGMCCPPSGIGWDVTTDCCYYFYPEYFLVDCDPAGNQYYWEFGDGNTSTEQYPTHCYASEGLFTVCLTVTCPDGNTYSYCEWILSDCNPCDVALFPNVVQDGCIWTVTFVNGGSTPLNEICVMIEGGVVITADQYIQVLDFSNDCDSGWGICYQYWCCNDPDAVPIGICVDYIVDCCCDTNSDFTYTTTDDCCTQFFYPGSQPFDCILWNFGDGTTSNELNPVHCWGSPGVYTVCLTTCCIDASGNVISYQTVCHDVTVDCCTLPFEWFSSVTGCTVCFSPIYEGPNPSDCIFWDFGDGQTGYGVNPCHTYAASGTYTVCMYAWCCNSLPVDVFALSADVLAQYVALGIVEVICHDVTVNCPCDMPCDVHAAFNQVLDNNTFTFTNLSHAGTGTTIVSYHWDFGDGNISNLEHPVHTYTQTGNYVVCLTVVGVTTDGQTCTDTLCFNVTIPCLGDLNGDGVVNIVDMLLFLGAFGSLCP